jgi:hypothetical protein
MTVRRTVFDRDVLALDEADLAQTLPEGIRQGQWLRGSLVKKSYDGELLLRSRRNRPRRRTAEQRYEFASFHRITSRRPGGRGGRRLRARG